MRREKWNCQSVFGVRLPANQQMNAFVTLLFETLKIDTVDCRHAVESIFDENSSSERDIRRDCLRSPQSQEVPAENGSVDETSVYGTDAPDL